MACLLPSVIDAVDVVDVVDVVDADSVDDVLWIPRVERLRQSRRHHRPSHRCCLSHRHQPAPDPLHTFSTFCQTLRDLFVEFCGETLFANFPSCCFICRPGHGCVPARAAAK